MCVALVGKLKLCNCVRVERLWLELEKFKKDARAIIPFRCVIILMNTIFHAADRNNSIVCRLPRNAHVPKYKPTTQSSDCFLCARIRHCIAFAHFSFHLILFSTHTQIYYPANFSTALRNESIFPRTAVAIGFTKAHALFLRYYTLSIHAR